MQLPFWLPLGDVAFAVSLLCSRVTRAAA